MKLERAGRDLVIEAGAYRLVVPAGKGVAWLDDGGGDRWAELRLLASIDAVDGTDETLAAGEAQVEAEQDDAIRLTWELASSRWTGRRLILEAGPDRLAFSAEVHGTGAVTDVTLLSGRAVLERTNGFLMSGAWFETLFSPSPSDPGRIVRSASESTAIGVVTGSEPGRGNWFFTPGPFCYAAARPPVMNPLQLPSGPWLTFELEAEPGTANFGGFSWRARDRGFGFALDYEGKTVIDGSWRTPRVVIGFAPDPYAAIAAHRDRLIEAGLAPPPAGAARARPDWWREPIFCGWGAQAALARSDGRPLSAAPDYATAANYESFLGGLAARGIVPGTIVVDDKWQLDYGTNAPDAQRWPDLRGWIASRRDGGQRVLLWYRAWSPEGLPPEACIRNGLGKPIAVDPTSAAGEAAIRASVRTIVGSAELDADGLKIDFTGRAPSGVSSVHHGDAWGVELLRRLLDIVADEARSLKPDVLLIGHTPNALIAPAVDMLRLNDALRLDDPHPSVDIVPQMQYRAAVVKAACPDHLIDTDDWCAPNLAGWRAYAAAKPALGVPALYYATHLDLTGEAFDDADYELIGSTWAAYRAREGLPAR
jgi:hypothetical protein